MVVGCHRSGTSAVTGALAAMGLHGVDSGDRLDDSTSNPEHWESLGATLHDEQLLIAQGGTWDAPPPADADPLLPDAGAVSEVATIMAAAYPEPGPLVWKDPRACLLLPYWRSLLPGPLTVVFVWRAPLAVARSLHTRDGLPLVDGIALWEHYNRSAAIGLQGVDTYVLDYESVVADPTTALAGLGTWLGNIHRLAPRSGTWEVATAAALIDNSLRHESSDTDDRSTMLPGEHLALAAWLRSMAGGHTALDRTPPSAGSVWPEALLAVRRELTRVRGTVDAHVAEQIALQHRLDIALAAQVADRIRLDGARQEIEGEQMKAEGELMKYQGVLTTLERMQASTSWKVTAPLRAVLTKIEKRTAP
jgi:hypothetical protein